MAVATGRILAVVTRVESFHAFALDDWGTSYFILGSAVETTGRWGFAHLQPGSIIKLTAIDHPKGPRGIEVQIIER